MERINRRLITTANFPIDFRKLGVIHPSGRIKEMNEKHGYNINKVEQRTVYDDEGFPHPRIAFYVLIERPVKGEK